jgi:hypothetical protein
MHKDKNYIIVKDRHPRISEVKNDCVNLCVPASKGESLALILQKICSKFTTRDTELTTLIETLQTEIELLETQSVDYQEQIDDLQEQIDNLDIPEVPTLASGTWDPDFTNVDGFSSLIASLPWNYIRVGDVVSFSGLVSGTITNAGEKYCTFTLPVAIGSGNLEGTISAVASGSAFQCNGYLAETAGQGWITFATTLSSGTYGISVSGHYNII